MYYQKLQNQKIGKWTVIGVDDHGKNKKTKMKCRCDCGNIRSVDAYSLWHRLTLSCGRCNTISNEGDYMRCTMKNGTSFIFDSKDEAIVRAHTWSVAGGHIRTVINGKTTYLHRLIMNEPRECEIDHINLDKKDNRRCNLRIVTHSQNQMNRKIRADNTTGYKGVCFDCRSGKYIAYINASGIREYLGYFNNPVDAAKAYDVAAIRLHGEYARLNINKESDENEEQEVLDMEKPNSRERHVR